MCWYIGRVNILHRLFFLFHGSNAVEGFAGMLRRYAYLPSHANEICIQMKRRQQTTQQTTAGAATSHVFKSHVEESCDVITIWAAFSLKRWVMAALSLSLLPPSRGEDGKMKWNNLIKAFSSVPERFDHVENIQYFFLLPHLEIKRSERQSLSKTFPSPTNCACLGAFSFFHEAHDLFRFFLFIFLFTLL